MKFLQLPRHPNSVHPDSTSRSLEIPSVSPPSVSMADKTPKYTAEEIEEYKQVFALFDTDGSGAIGNDELGEAMRSMGMNPSEKELENLIKEVDVDGNGEIDFDEFCMVMKRMSTKKESDEEIIRSCFTVFDQDRNGIVSETEFKYIFTTIGNFTEAQTDEIFKEIDIDGNGQVDFDEFAQMVRTYLLEEEKPDEPDLKSPSTPYTPASTLNC